MLIVVLLPILNHPQQCVTARAENAANFYLFFSAENTCIYSGPDTAHTITDLQPSETVSLRLRASVPGDDSPLSETVTVTTEEDVPQEPSNLCVLARTATQLKIGWEPPASYSGVIKSYHVYLGMFRKM